MRSPGPLATALAIRGQTVLVRFIVVVAVGVDYAIELVPESANLFRWDGTSSFCTGCEGYKLARALLAPPFVSCPLPPQPSRIRAHAS